MFGLRRDSKAHIGKHRQEDLSPTPDLGRSAAAESRAEEPTAEEPNAKEPGAAASRAEGSNAKEQTPEEPRSSGLVASLPAAENFPVCRGTFEIGIDRVRHVEPRLDAGSTPYRPDTVVDGGVGHGVVVRAASVRGRAKRFHGRAREDDFCLLVSSARPAVIVAVADGVGNAKRSSLGAMLAVRHAVEAVEEQLLGGAPDALDWPKVFNRAAAALVVEHRREAGEESLGRPDHDETKAVSGDLGTTLTVAVIERDSNQGANAWVAAIGDSPVFRLVGGVYELLVGERETDEDFSTSSVIALPYLPRPEVRNVSLKADEVLLICTDGFSEPLGAGNSDVGRLFARELAAPPPLPSWSYLVDFAKATYDDDRTLVAVWPSGAGVDGTRSTLADVAG